MKNITGLTLIAAALAGCNKDWPVDEVVMLENIEVVPGKHGESSAIVNALPYPGYDIDETTLFAAGGGISFLYQKGTFPFIGGRSGDLREAALDTLDITWFVERPGKDDSKRDKIIQLSENEFHWLEKKPAGYGFDWRTIRQRSIEQVIRNRETNVPDIKRLNFRRLNYIIANKNSTVI